MGTDTWFLDSKYLTVKGGKSGVTVKEVMLYTLRKIMILRETDNPYTVISNSRYLPLWPCCKIFWPRGNNLNSIC